jgi:GTPase SAR1 family protein
MSEHFFIGREKEIQKLEYHLLHQDSQTSNLRVCHLWGREGIGKSSLIRHFSQLLFEENDPTIWVSGDLDRMQSDTASALIEVNGSAKSNVGDFEPWLQQIRDARLEESAPESPSENPKSWKFSILNAIHAAHSSNSYKYDKLRFVVLLDDFYQYPESSRQSILRQLVQIARESDGYAIIGLVLTSENDLSDHPQTYAYLSQSNVQPLQLELNNFTHDESLRFLKAHHVDSGQAQRIWEHSQGFPRQLAIAVQNQDSEGEDRDILLRKGEQMLFALNNMQRNWIKWAAIMRSCDRESFSLLIDHRELNDCLNWVAANYPVYFDREKTGYVLRPEYQQAILEVLKERQPELFEKTNRVVQQLQSVKNGIPNLQHRQLLSNLAQFQYFDLGLIRRVFDEQTATELYQLLESKPIFFRTEGDSIRLASNTRSSITLYNKLIPLLSSNIR